MRVLSIGADRSKRGILYYGSPASERQAAYAARLGILNIVGFSRQADGARGFTKGALSVYPTNSTGRWRYIRDAVRIARSLPKPGVITAQDPFESGIAAWLIARESGIPLHVQLHTDLFSPEYARHSVLNRIRSIIARLILRRASRIRVVSEKLRDSLVVRGYARNTISVLPIFTDLSRFRNPVVPADVAQRFAGFKWKVLVVSRLEPEKNPCLALRAFAEAAPADACLIIVGAGSERRHLEVLAQEFDISNRVFFEGEQDPAQYYALADLVLVTSRYEGYGLVIVEALAAGKPVLSTDVGVAREAGAIVASREAYAAVMRSWFSTGERAGVLRMPVMPDLDSYAERIAEDLMASVRTEAAAGKS